MKLTDLPTITKIRMLKAVDGVKVGELLVVEKGQVIYNHCLSGKKSKGWLKYVIENDRAKPHIKTYPFK